MKVAYVNTFENPDLSISYDKQLDNLREQAILCDQGTFHSFWLAEHHFGVNGRDNSPNPFMVATDLGSRTTRIRLGLGAVILPLWHPLRAAENIALLDQLLKGRLEVGFGRASQPHEVVTFNPRADPRNPAGSRAVFAESLEIVRMALTEEFFSYEGENYQFPAKGVSWSSRAGFEDDPRWIKDGEIYQLSLVPKPYQKPHPPFWLAISSEGSSTVAGQLGLQPMAWRQTALRLRDWVGHYQSARIEAGHPCPQPGKEWAILRNVFVAPTMEQARRIYEPIITQIMRYRAADPYRALQAFLDPGEEATPDMGLDWDFLWNRALIAGSPEQVVDQIQELQEISGIGTLLASVAHEGLAQDEILKCIELLNEKVLPEVEKMGNSSVESTATA